MKVKYQYKKRNKFKHLFTFTDIEPEKKIEIYNWLVENGGKYNIDYRYWSLKNSYSFFYARYSEVYFSDKSEINAMAFKLKWIE